MYFHALRYTFLKLIRNKAQFFWCLAFPILLSTMFYFAFSGFSEDEHFSAIPVAVVLGDEEDNALHEMLDELSEPGEDQFLSTTYVTEDEALSLLEQKEIIGILYANSPITLTVSAQMSGETLQQSILNCFVQQFNMSYAALTEMGKSHPEKLPDALNALSAETNYLNDTSLSDGNFSEALTYFFNLLAMSCLFAAMLGNDIAVDNQANLSALGARRSISPVHRLTTALGDISAAFLFQFISVSISICYMHYVLAIDFGNQIGYLVLASMVGCFTGVSLGFFIGSFGKANKDTKFGILMAVVMICCMLSGLMIGNMRIIVEKICPFFNKINPAALISDSFYSLVVYPSHTRYFENIITLLILSFLFSMGGFILIRRKKYASL